MGTRADFYVGRGPKARWLGSIAWDGDFVPRAVSRARTARDFRFAVAKFLKKRDDGTLPEMGWPWPWENSSLSDYAYAFDRRVVYRAEHDPNDNYPVKWWVPMHGTKRLIFEKLKRRAARLREKAAGDGPFVIDLKDAENPERDPCKRNNLKFPNMHRGKTGVTIGPRSGVLVVKVQE